MKKLIALFLVAVMCISVFAACNVSDGTETSGTESTTTTTAPSTESGSEQASDTATESESDSTVDSSTESESAIPDDSNTESSTETTTEKPDDETTTAADDGLTKAAAYLKGMYKTKDIGADFEVVGKVVSGGVTYTVTWSVDNADIKVVAKGDNYVIDVPVKNDAPVNFKLTATVADANGKTENVVFSRTLIVYDLSAYVGNPEEGVAYKFFFVQVGLGQTLFANGETDNNKYLKTTTKAKEAPDFFVEKDGEGFKFFTEIGGKKMYVYASTVDNNGKVSKYISYSETESTTWTYDSETNAWFTTINNAGYVVGTYGTYNTFSISDASYMTKEASGKTQFPGGLMLKAAAEEIEAAEVIIYKTPEEIVKAVYALNIGETLSAGHKYTLTGVVTEIPSPYDEAYGNATFVIVVEGLTEMPIECFRVKGNGMEDVQIGDTITVTGQLLKYDNKSETGKVEFNSGCSLDKVVASGSTDDTTTTAPDGDETTAPDGDETTAPEDDNTLKPTTSPEVGKAYKLMVEQGNVGQTLYFTGKTASYDYYLASSENVADAVDVFVEEATGGYKMYFTIDGTKTYITFKQSGTHYNTGLVTSADDAAVLTWDTEYNTFTATVEDGTVVYLGMYNTYKTFSASKYSYISGSFPSKLVA